jgi:hypothetical protein
VESITELVTVNVVAGELTLMMEAISSFETSVLQESHGVASQKTAFFILLLGCTEAS